MSVDVDNNCGRRDHGADPQTRRRDKKSFRRKFGGLYVQNMHQPWYISHIQYWRGSRIQMIRLWQVAEKVFPSRLIESEKEGW